jgi:hypothetical protein
MRKAIPALLLLALCPALRAFELPAMRAAEVRETAGPGPTAPLAAAFSAGRAPTAQASFASYQVNGVDVKVPHIGCGHDLLAVLRPGEKPEDMAAGLRAAFGAAAAAVPTALTPASKAELELAAQNPGAAIVSLNQFLPPAAAALFNREAGFAGPNCFDAAFTAGGIMPAGKLRHVGNPEADQLLSMYYRSVPASALKPGDVLVLNDGDHAVYYLGGGLIFHKKSYLKQHIYRIVQLEKAYEPEPYEWKPGIFDGGSPFNDSETIRDRKAWRPSGAHYDFGQASADEKAKAETILFLEGQVETQAPRWALARELGYFTERLLENLVSDWSAMAASPNPVLRAYYHELESLRDQANQSIESELLSSPNSQSHADDILKGVWLPRNDYSRALTGRLLKICGQDPALTEKALDAIGRDYDGSPLRRIKDGGR